MTKLGHTIQYIRKIGATPYLPKCSLNFLTLPRAELRSNRNQGLSIIGGYWSRRHFHAVCFSGFSAMLDLYMGDCQAAPETNTKEEKTQGCFTFMAGESKIIIFVHDLQSICLNN